MTAENTTLTGLARKFVLDQLLDEETARKAQLHAHQNNLSLVSHLVEAKAAKAKDLAFSAAQEFGMPVLDLNAFQPESFPEKVVDEKLIRKHHALPLFMRGNRLFIAVSDPTNIIALDEIKFHTGASVDAILVEDDKLNAAIEKYLESQDTTMGDLDDADLDDIDVDQTDDSDNEVSASDADDAPIVKYVNKMLLDAIKTGASDLHFEPYEKSYRVRYRTDGILHEVSKPSIKLAPKISARLKVMSSWIFLSDEFHKMDVLS